MLWAVLNRQIGSITEFLFVLAGYAVLLFIMMPVHEAAHALAADKLGDSTARWNRRLTLNPLAHLDPVGAVLIVLFGIGYAKPVPVNPRNFKNPRRDMALTALAGPVSNLLMAFVSLLLFRVLLLVSGGAVQVANGSLWFTSRWMVYAYIVLVQVMAGVNLSLAVFNLLPLPPLDGSRIFGALFPPKWTYWMDRYHEYVRLAVLLVVVTGVLDQPLSWVMGLIGNLFCTILRLPALF